MCKKIETNENFFSLGEILVREISPELLKQESETGDILGCNATGEKILTTTYLRFTAKHLSELSYMQFKGLLMH